MLAHTDMDIWATGTLQAMSRDAQPPLTTQDYRTQILSDIKNACEVNNVIHGRVRLKIDDIRGYMDGVAQMIEALQAENQQLKRDAMTFETVTEVTPEPATVEWLTVAQYAKAHGKAYSTVAGYKLRFGDMTRQDPNHSGRWQIRADAPYPKK